jgi:zinc transporter ZupT
LLPFLPTFLAAVGAFIFPTIVGLLVLAGAARVVSARYLAAFALGIYLWFFSDTIGDSAYLDVNSGFGGGTAQVALVLLFAVGLVLLFSLDRSALGPDSTSRSRLSVPLLVALAVGIHGLGEGAALSATAAVTPATGILDAFGGTSAAAAFVLHKALEPMMVGAAYWVYARERAKDPASLLKDMLLLAFVFVLPGIIGAATDYNLGYDTTYFFALGLGTSIYALVRLARPLFSETSDSKWDSTRVAVLVLAGFLCIYLAALLHS